MRRVGCDLSALGLRYRSPFPDGMNVFARFYIDWAIQFHLTALFFIMFLTTSTFLVGMSWYISEIVRDLRTSLDQFDANAAARDVIEAILLHQKMLK